MPASKRDLQRFVLDLGRRFDYYHDRDLHGVSEDWRIPEMRDGRYQGDCDDYAILVAEWGKARGLKMRLVLCWIPTRTGLGGHLVAYCEDYGLFADCNHRGAWDRSRVSNWEWSKMSRVNQWTRWVNVKL